MSAYLFVHFTNDKSGDREYVWFSVSRDGLNWQDIGGEEPILSCKLGTTGVRDPFIVYDEKLSRYFLIATDLCTVKGGNWGDFSMRGSRSIVVWESENLIQWSEERLVEVGIPEAGCVWAPEAVYCKEKEKWFVFWASCVEEKDDNEPKQRIYGAFTDDFRNFTPAFKYMEGETAFIDTDIVCDKGVYYRFSKDETNKVIIAEKSPSLIPENGEFYEKIPSEYLDSHPGLEGPQCFGLENGKWCLLVDRYRSGKGYMPLICDNLDSGSFYELPESSYNMGKRKKRHGGVIKISDDQAQTLIEHFGIA